MKRLRTLTAGWMFMLLASAGNAHAESFTLGAVSIDWTALTFSGISIDFADDTFFSGSGASSVADDVSDFDFSTALAWTDTFAFAAAATPGAQAVATASTTDTEISAFATQNAAGGGKATSNADANREVNFIARETGTLTVSAPLSMLTQVNVGLPNESAGTSLDGTLWLFSPVTLSFDNFRVFPNFEGVGSSRDLISRTLTTSVFFESGQQGRFLATVSATGFVTSVPEPATALLFGLGLATSVLWRKSSGEPH